MEHDEEQLREKLRRCVHEESVAIAEYMEAERAQKAFLSDLAEEYGAYEKDASGKTVVSLAGIYEKADADVADRIRAFSMNAVAKQRKLIRARNCRKNAERELEEYGNGTIGLRRR